MDLMLAGGNNANAAEGSNNAAGANAASAYAAEDIMIKLKNTEDELRRVKDRRGVLEDEVEELKLENLGMKKAQFLALKERSGAPHGQDLQDAMASPKRELSRSKTGTATAAVTSPPPAQREKR